MSESRKAASAVADPDTGSNTTYLPIEINDINSVSRSFIEQLPLESFVNVYRFLSTKEVAALSLNKQLLPLAKSNIYWRGEHATGFPQNHLKALEYFAQLQPGADADASADIDANAGVNASTTTPKENPTKNKLNTYWYDRFFGARADKSLPHSIERFFFYARHSDLESIKSIFKSSDFNIKQFITDALTIANKDNLNFFQLLNREDAQSIFDLIYTESTKQYFHPDGSLKRSYMDNEGRTLLHIAVICRQNKELIQLLLDEKFDLHKLTKKGETALYYTATLGYEDTTEALLTLGAKDQVYVSLTPILYRAAQRGYLKITQLLLKYKHSNDIKVNERSSDGSTALYIASQNGHADVAELLIDHGAEIETKFNTYTPLYIASQNNRKKVVDLLLRKGANIETSGGEGSTSLYISAQQGHLEIVLLLLRYNAKIEACYKSGFTPLYVASRNGNTDVVKALLEQNANVDACDGDGSTSLYVASQNGHHGSVDLLLKYKADPHLLFSDGYDALYISSQNGHTKITASLLAAKANPNRKHSNGSTSLYVACQNGHIGVVKELLKCNADTSITFNGYSPLYISAQKNHIEIAKALIQAGADVNSKTNKKATPLYVAAQKGYMEMVTMLLDAGANINETFENGMTPVHISAQEHSTYITKLLLRNGAKVSGYDFTTISTLTCEHHILFILKAYVEINTSNNPHANGLKHFVSTPKPSSENLLNARKLLDNCLLENKEFDEKNLRDMFNQMHFSDENLWKILSTHVNRLLLFKENTIQYKPGR